MPPKKTWAAEQAEEIRRLDALLAAQRPGPAKRPPTKRSGPPALTPAVCRASDDPATQELCLESGEPLRQALADNPRVAPEIRARLDQLRACVALPTLPPEHRKAWHRLQIALVDGPEGPYARHFPAEAAEVAAAKAALEQVRRAGPAAAPWDEASAAGRLWRAERALNQKIFPEVSPAEAAQYEAVAAGVFTDIAEAAEYKERAFELMMNLGISRIDPATGKPAFSVGAFRVEGDRWQGFPPVCFVSQYAGKFARQTDEYLTASLGAQLKRGQRVTPALAIAHLESIGGNGYDLFQPDAQEARLEAARNLLHMMSPAERRAFDRYTPVHEADAYQRAKAAALARPPRAPTTGEWEALLAEIDAARRATALSPPILDARLYQAVELAKHRAGADPGREAQIDAIEAGLGRAEVVIPSDCAPD